MTDEDKIQATLRDADRKYDQHVRADLLKFAAERHPSATDDELIEAAAKFLAFTGYAPKLAD